jgi:predicted transcriptional regulator
MQHRGENIKEAVYKSGFPITALAKRMGKSRRWVYLLFENPTVPIEIILQIGSIIHYDFSSEIELLKSNPQVSNEPKTNYTN